MAMFVRTKGGTMRKSLLIHPEELSKKWIDRFVAQGVDTVGLHPVGGNDAEFSLERLTQRMQEADYQALIDYAREQGLKIEYEFHSCSWLLPRGLFEQHPEYFRVDTAGNRTTDRNFCVTNEDALQFVVDRSVQLAKALYGSENRYFFWLDDGKNQHCHCEQCKNLSPSDQNLMTMNAIVTALRKEDPDAQVAYLAYQDCMAVPQQVRPAPGIFLEYAPIERCFDKPLRESMQPQIPAIQELLDYFGTTDSKVLEYWYDNSLFSGWKKPPQRFEPKNQFIPDDIAFYRELGFEDISSFACYLGEDYEALYGEPDISAF